MQLTKVSESHTFGKRDSIMAVDRFGRTTSRQLRIGEFKKERGLTGAEAKKEYAKYLRQSGRRGRTVMLGMLNEYDLLLTSVKQTKNGYNFQTVTRASTEPKLTKREEAADRAKSTEEVLSGASAADLKKSLEKNSSFTKEEMAELLDLIANKLDAVDAVSK